MLYEELIYTYICEWKWKCKTVEMYDTMCLIKSLVNLICVIDGC